MRADEESFYYNHFVLRMCFYLVLEYSFAHGVIFTHSMYIYIYTYIYLTEYLCVYMQITVYVHIILLINACTLNIHFQIEALTKRPGDTQQRNSVVILCRLVFKQTFI